MSQATTVSALVAGIGDGMLATRGNVSQAATDYATLANVAAAIAAEVWAITLDVGASASSASLLQSVAAGIMSGRSPTSITATDYAVLAGAIKAAYTQLLTKITP
jgi:hypothetical protein